MEILVVWNGMKAHTVARQIYYIFHIPLLLFPTCILWNIQVPYGPCEQALLSGPWKLRRMKHSVWDWGLCSCSNVLKCNYKAINQLLINIVSSHCASVAMTTGCQNSVAISFVSLGEEHLIIRSTPLSIPLFLHLKRKGEKIILYSDQEVWEGGRSGGSNA